MSQRKGGLRFVNFRFASLKGVKCGSEARIIRQVSQRGPLRHQAITVKTSKRRRQQFKRLIRVLVCQGETQFQGRQITITRCICDGHLEKPGIVTLQFSGLRAEKTACSEETMLLATFRKPQESPLTRTSVCAGFCATSICFFNTWEKTWSPQRRGKILAAQRK